MCNFNGPIKAGQPINGAPPLCNCSRKVLSCNCPPLGGGSVGKPAGRWRRLPIIMIRFGLVFKQTVWGGRGERTDIKVGG